MGQLGEQADLENKPRRILAEPVDIQFIDVVLSAPGGIEIRRRSVTQPTDQQMLLQCLERQLSAQKLENQ